MSSQERTDATFEAEKPSRVAGSHLDSTESLSSGSSTLYWSRYISGDRPARLVEWAAKWALWKPTQAAYILGLLATMLAVLGGMARAAERSGSEGEHQRGTANIGFGQSDRARSPEETDRAEADLQREKRERFEYGRTMQMAHQATSCQWQPILVLCHSLILGCVG